ncbi:hypothetical protein GCM10010156_74110 [Planobispora rosea]|uniref:HTH marR-type domain-containing protein n=1 Tax=Planobispora rosea TaxID=35762 RepID=A0A8J3WGV8_PLARO|nr:winged helix-turn-helix domain-containing protein [Planobispora rosea]GGT05562.1 hypothetical protein GCM10010156_74110 [Planobispora rosea]GIH88940.1 hypothetical protein Pro02_73480 [Planobispora rosea]
MSDTAKQHSAWTFLTHHTRVLRMIAADPQARLRDIAAAIGITERAVGRIVSDLRQAGYIDRQREGRRNRYAILPGRHLRHPSQRTIPVQALLDLFHHGGGASGPAADDVTTTEGRKEPTALL